MASKAWFITGTSSGFGHAWATAALERGDRVAGTARDVRSMDDLVAEYGDAFLPFEFDVRDRSACFAAVQRAHGDFGRLDVIVNNAGYGQNGMVEELREHEARDQMDTNFFGPLWITQAALPFLREQGAGHIVQVSSVGGVLAFPGLGMYNASKWALEGLTQALADEVASFGIRVTLIEPGGFATGVGDRSRQTDPLAAYDPVYKMSRDRASQRRSVLGDPTASGRVLLQIVDGDDPPLRVFFGGQWLSVVATEYETRLASWRESQPLSELAARH